MKSNKLLTKVFTLASQGLYPAQIAEALGVSNPDKLLTILYKNVYDKIEKLRTESY